jgi:hypothetical protein
VGARINNLEIIIWHAFVSVHVDDSEDSGLGNKRFKLFALEGANEYCHSEMSRS